VVGVLGRQLSSGSTVSGGQVQDKNNVIYTPLTSLQYRFWDNNWFKDDLDGIDMRLKPGADSIEVAKVVIAAISLLVGGIGIMNIVLATVLERTREIGVRRATGARRNDIVRQFLTESVLISVGGGALGIAFGYLLSWLIARTAEWKTIVTTSSIFIAFGVSVAVGVIFGIYPAVKASRVDPIEALRYE
jgi:putative ABC transport system permease protein